jgi:LuxR family maltose regulon positive regulatory protein
MYNRSMSISILATKLFIPPPRPGIVPRPHLIERLNEVLVAGRKLALISAPAGFGKTTLVSEWVASCGQPVAWLSLDDGDNDLTRFLTYLVAALQTIVANIGAGALAVLQSPQPPSSEAILTGLLNEIAAIQEKFIFVLDDYHMVDAQAVDQSLGFLVEHLPPQVHLVIASREDPHLPLARLRARGQLTELRAADLRFTHAEAAEFLNQVMGLNLSAEDIAALETRTEGWIAGLQLAALSMQGRSDAASFIQAFTGSHRFVLDYLVGEVLQRQPEGIHSFLLKTAILDRLSGSLCDAVTGREDGKGMLETLERGNLFIIPLDDQRQWYRYRPLFAEVLQARLPDEQPDQVFSLHQRASGEWERTRMPMEAFCLKN